MYRQLPLFESERRNNILRGLIIDTHTHIFRFLGRRTILSKAKLGSLRDSMTNSGIRLSIVLNVAQTDELRESNTSILKLLSDCRNLIPFISIDPSWSEKQILNEIERCNMSGAKGLKLHPIAQRFYPNDRALWSCYAKCQELRWIIVFHTGYSFTHEGKKYVRPSLLDDMLFDFPELVVIAAHLGGEYCDEIPELANRHENIFFDTSLAVFHGEGKRYKPFPTSQTIRIIEKTGADRILFGSDFPSRSQIGSIEGIMSLPLSNYEKEMILGRNAERLLSIRGII
jgi:predicted TIM-barrel fold metal-dependent hydrolase